MARLLAAEAHPLLLHELQYVPVADRRAQKPQAVLCAVFVQADVRHDRRDEAAAVQAALFLHLCGADGYHLVAVNDAALLVDGQAAVGVAVERDAEIIAAGFDRVTERFQMR